MSDPSPSWVTPPDRRARPPAEDRAPTPLTLPLAVVATAGLVVAQAFHVIGRDELVAGLRGFLVVVVALQVALAVGALRRSAGAALGLLVCQLTTAVASLVGGFGDRRLAYAAGSIAVFGLVAASLGSFPAAPLPPLQPTGHPTVPPTDGEGAR